MCIDQFYEDVNEGTALKLSYSASLLFSCFWIMLVLYKIMHV